MSDNKGIATRVYIAGPIAGSGLQLQNVRQAMLWGERVWKDGMIPFVPHLYSFWDYLIPHGGEEWLGLDLKWLETCHALLRLPGASPGSDREWGRAMRLGIRCFRSWQYDALREWHEDRFLPTTAKVKAWAEMKERASWGDFPEDCFIRGKD